MEDRGFFEGLFDISFSSLITPKVIKFVYVLSMVLIGLFALFLVGAAFSNSVAGGIVVLLVVAPLLGLLYLIYVRVLLELVIVIFRIMETNSELVDLQKGRSTGQTPPPTPPPAPPSTPPPGPVAGLS
jgi:Domain of unknown function (DUF4282)